MERKLKKRLLVILMIITILSADFLILGSNLTTYASQISKKTNNPNVEFLAYFKNDKGENVDSIEESIKSENLKLYAEIKVKNEGYLNEGSTIEIEDSNFNIKNNILSPYINSINGNKVVLKQISEGEPVEIVLDIEPIITDTMTADMLSKTSIVKLNGTYTASTNAGIQYGRQVNITFKEDEAVVAELESDIITNKVLSVNGTNKRIIQLMVRSRLADNQYPVEQTTLKVAIPELSGTQPEKVEVLAIGKLATNSETEISKDNVINENGVLQININNKPDGNNKITWNKDVYDKLVVTYVYAEDVKVSNLEITTNSEIKVYNSEKTYKGEYVETENKELNNIIMTESQFTTHEMYKGQLYANINAAEKKDVSYDTITKLVVTTADVVDEVVLHEGTDVFEAGETELAANTKYVTTEINKNKMLEILGQDGNIEIKNGEKATLINKDSQVNENGNIVINHEDGTTELDFTTSGIVKAGILEIKHTKVIGETNYTRDQLQKVKSIKTKNSVEGTIAEDKEKQNVVENSTEASFELKETISKAELTVNKESLSTTQENEVTLGVKLITDGVQYDLFKNPTISIQLPASVEDVRLIEKPSKLYADEFEIKASYNSTNKIIQIKLAGEQTTYPTSELTQAYLQLNLGITLSKLATDKTDKIVMSYVNENATQYVGGTTEAGTVEQTIQISAQPGLQKIFNVSLNENTSQTQTIKQQITSENVKQTVEFETQLVNNTGSDMNNVRIVGKLPTTGNLIEGQENTNSFETTLAGINASNATIYYTTDVNATVETKNAWTTNPTNAKMYLINLGTLTQGSNYTATVNVQMPNVLKEGAESYTDYKVIYDTESKTNIEEVSRQIALVTDTVSDLQVKLTAQVGEKELNNGDTIKEGEVIKYKVTLTNNTEAVLENITLTAGVPEGTVVVNEMENYEYLLNTYYEEKADITEMSLTIPTLQVGETQTQYEVRVNSDITTGTEISNKVTATYNNTTTESKEITNKLEEANVRVTIKKAIDEAIRLTAGSETEYDLIIENLSNETVNNLGVEIISDDFSLDGQEITVGEIPANGKINLKIKGKINDNAEKMNISAIATDSNNTYRSNVVTEELIQADATITLTTPQNNASLKEGDVVEYSIVVENTGNVSEYFKVYYSIPHEFAVQSVNINGTVSQISDETKISNLVYEGMNLEVGQKGTIDITAKVENVAQAKVITNKTKVEVLNVYKSVSQEVTHTLLPASIPEDETKNIISGSAWLDANVNGQKDNEETALEGVKVKLYDTATHSYVLNEEGNAITETTNSDGEYIFTKISNGSYILVFEYDVEKYELTTYLAEGVDPTVNSKATLKNITVNDEIITVAGTETLEVQDNVTYMNIGLKEKSATPPVENTKRTITGHAWLDANKNGQKDDEEAAIPAIKVKVYDISTSDYIKDANGKIVETTTNSNGEYYLTNIEKGSYKIVFEFDVEKYELTTYLAEGVDETKTSKVILNKITINGNEIEVAATDMIELQDDITDVNIGLKEKIVIPPTDDGGNGDNGNGDNGNDNNGNDNNGNDNNGNDNNGNDNNGNDNNGNDNNGNDNNGNDNNGNDNNGNNDAWDKDDGNVISGLAWLDSNRNGQKDAEETTLSGIKVKLYEVSTNNYLKDENNNIVETSTDAKGKYIFNDIEKGSYIVVFEYDTEEYEPTTYLAEGVDTTKNSKVILKKINIDGQEITAAITDTINVQANILNINIGLKEKLIHDLELSKYISRIVVQNNKGTKSYDYENKTLAKVEIHKKQMQGSLVVLEYAIKIKNNGEIAGYAQNIVDYLPKGLTFNSELNADWYLSGDYLYTKSLENVELKPGEEKEVKIILTKTMTSENTGLINNRAEIYKDYNQYGEVDIDSTPNNQVQGEDDTGSVDVIIGTSTGGSVIAYIILVMINVILMGIAIKIMIQNNIIKISTKEERR